MRMQIKEFAKMSGVSVRTLHYYDEIGLLKAAFVDKETGYRYYDEQSLLCMQQILFYRELDFPLKEIGEILSSPDYNKEEALLQQKKLLMLKKDRLERLILSIDSAMKGENIMGTFDNSEFENYKAEAKEKWGRTDAWKEQQEKTKGYTKDKWQSATDGLDGIFAEFGACLKSGENAESDAAQSLVKKLQQHITDDFYTCTSQILSGLGQMYVADERFSNHIDKNGPGTAAFVSEAIAAYCK